MDTVTRNDAVYLIAPKVNLSLDLVRSVLKGYTRYIRKSVENGCSISFLRICTIEVRDNVGYRETFAYTCTELANELGVNPAAVKGILMCYEDIIIRDLKRYCDHSVTALFSLTRKETGGKIGVYIKRSNTLATEVNYILRMRHSFKRKVVGE